MSVVTIIVIAVGLAMDAFAVSVASGAAYKELKLNHALKIAFFFGGFQAVMPIIGSLAGLGLKSYIAGADHWVAFGLLAAIGGKMIYESFKIEPSRAETALTNPMVLLALSVATSIDALAVGITLSMLRASVVLAAIIIGLVTFLLSYAGVYIGRRFGHFFESKIEAIGGLVLIAIGIKVLIEHLHLA